MIKVQLDSGAFMPIKAHAADAGFDLYSTEEFTIEPRSTYLVDTGVHMAIPEGHVGFIKSRSSMAIKHNIMADAGVIDSGYTGAIKVRLYNQTNLPYKVKRSDRICQIVVLKIGTEPLVVVKNLEDTERGTNGFGSSGK